MTAKSQSSPGQEPEEQPNSLLLAENKTEEDFAAGAGEMTAGQMTTPRHPFRLVGFFGSMFFAVAIYEEVIHRRDAMASTLLFVGLSVFAVAYGLHNIEKRLASLEQRQKSGETGNDGSK
jgi:hypothetical protein